MAQYFVYDYTGNPFILFGLWHLVALAVVGLVILSTLLFRGTSEKTRTTIRWIMAIILWVNEAGWHIWNIYWGHWTIDQLPLHICSLLIWLGGIMLVTRNYRIYEFAYFIGIAGALQALLTPDAGIYGFPHYRVFQTFISHGMLITAAVFMTVVEGFRPTWKSFWRVVAGLNIYMVINLPGQPATRTNFLYINHKPLTASLLDMLPPWPYYLIFMELIGLACSCYCPAVHHQGCARPQAAAISRRGDRFLTAAEGG